jgi:glycosyltransferase involved in cell wall biosynthesis
MTPEPAMSPTGRSGSQPRISVVLCTHNGEAWLDEQLQSIESQSLQPDELVVGDDASRDSTLGILQAFARRAAFPVHIARHEPPLGVVDNFEVTLSRARGQYVALSDQDDIWLPERIQRGVEAVRAIEGDGSTPVLAHSDPVLVDAAGVETGHGFMEARGLDGTVTNPLRVLLRHNLVTGCTVTCNRSLIERASPFPERLVMHDWWLALVAAATGEVTMIDSTLVHYRQHGGNQIGASRLMSLRGLGRVVPSRQSRRNLAAVLRQDLELGARLGDALPRDIRDFIEAIPRGGHRLRQAARRAGIRPQGLARRIRWWLETLTSGYRRWL